MNSHAANILALLDLQRCEKCGGPAVRGATVCVPCASKVTGDLEEATEDERSAG